MPCGRGADTVFLCVFIYVFLRFKCPADVALDGGDTLIVADTGNHCIRAVQAIFFFVLYVVTFIFAIFWGTDN
jgi:hypothetical protein